MLKSHNEPQSAAKSGVLIAVSDLWVSNMDKLIGQQIDHYRLTGLLGEGGMGVVYQGLDINLNRQVAIKVMHSRLARQRSFRQQFLQEAQAAARLDHPNIVPIYHFGAYEQFLYMVMRLVPGGSLGATMRAISITGKLIDIWESLAIVAQVADALDHAHSLGIVHRDIKPDNVLLRPLEKADRPGDPLIRALVSDFGLARMAIEGLDGANAALIGTLPYMSPEQCLGQEVDGRADLYALGTVLFQLTAGRLPFAIHSPASAVKMHTEAPVPDPAQFQSGIPTAVTQIIFKALAKQPGERFQSGKEMAQAVRLAAQQLTIGSNRSAASLRARSTGGRSGSDARQEPQNTLVIREKDGSSYHFHLTEKSYKIGRSRACDIILAGSGISREHAQLERTENGWTLTDLESTNGTYLAGTKIIPHKAEYWPVGQIVRIGNISIFWQTATQSIGGMTHSRPYRQPIASMGDLRLTEAERPPSPLPLSPTKSLEDTSINHSFSLRPQEVVVEPGQRVPVQLHIFNQTPHQRRFSYDLLDLPANWVTPVEEQLLLGSQSEGIMTFALHPPRHVTAIAGDYHFKVLIHSIPAQNDPSETGEEQQFEIPGKLTLRAFPAFEIDLSPKEIFHGKCGEITLKNQGNAIIRLTISASDQEEKLLFDLPEQALALEPGQNTLIPVRVRSQKRPWIGRKQKLSFVLQTDNKDIARKTEGIVIIPPRIPTWLLLMLILLLTGVLLWLMLFSGLTNFDLRETFQGALIFSPPFWG